MPAPLLRAALLAAAAAAAGCSFHRTDINDPTLPGRAERVVPGETKAADLPGILGSHPVNFIALPDGSRLLVYTYGQSKSEGLSLVVVSISRTNTAIDTAFFLADPSGVVREKWVGVNSKDVPWEWWAFGE